MMKNMDNQHDTADYQRHREDTIRRIVEPMHELPRNARDELVRMIACADAQQLAIFEDIMRRLAAGESYESIDARYGLKRTASGEYEPNRASPAKQTHKKP